MKIEDLKVLPKLYRVIKVELDVLRSSIGGCGGVFENDAIVERKVRRVMCGCGPVWQIARDHKDQENWDYFLESDRECLNDYNEYCNCDCVKKL